MPNPPVILSEKELSRRKRELESTQSVRIIRPDAIVLSTGTSGRRSLKSSELGRSLRTHIT